MTFFPFKIIPKKFLGIDIGTSAIKVVEMSRWGNSKKLENYGELQSKSLYQKPFRTFEKSCLTLSSKDISRAIKAILEEAEIETRQAAFSIPDFSSFFTTFEIPAVPKKELSQVVKYEARRYVPVPLSEVVLDWKVIKNSPVKNKEKPVSILLVTVPKEVVHQYQEIASLTELELLFLEAEVFGLIRSLVKPYSPLTTLAKREKEIIAIVDIGAQSTTINIVDKQELKISRSFDRFSGNELTKILSKSLNLEYSEAEAIKKKYGLLEKKEEPGLDMDVDVRSILLPLIDSMLTEIKKIFEDFYRKESKRIEKVILAGGTALLPNLEKYCQKELGKEVEIANPFTDIFYTSILEETLKEMGPSYAIAVGMALRGLE